jgi:hypothetical protein
MDGNSPVGAEGIPYEFETFTQLGVSDRPEVLDAGQAWRPKTGEKPVLHQQEFPVDNAVVPSPEALQPSDNPASARQPFSECSAVFSG